jgi:protein gp37
MKADGVYGIPGAKAWHPLAGCSMDLSCSQRCWARRTCARLAYAANADVRDFHRQVVDPTIGRGPGMAWTGRVLLNEAHLLDPLHWRKPQVIATGYHGDIALLSRDDLEHVFDVMDSARQHRFVMLTKRPSMLREKLYGVAPDHPVAILGGGDYLPNVYLGVSASNQAEADERLGPLMELAAMGWKTWLSLEPLVGDVNFRWAKWHPWKRPIAVGRVVNDHLDGLRWLRCVVAGGESGPGSRPCHPDWIRSIRDQCMAAGVAFEFKQWGDWAAGHKMVDRLNPLYGKIEQKSVTLSGGSLLDHPCLKYERMTRVGKRAAGRVLDGRTHDGFAEMLGKP